MFYMLILMVACFGNESQKGKSIENNESKVVSAENFEGEIIENVNGSGDNDTDLSVLNPEQLGEKLLLVCEKGKLADVERLLKAGADINYANKLGKTPLIIASIYGYLDIVELLINNSKIDINREDNQGQTPLMVAIMVRKENIAKLLIKQRKIDINKATNDGQTPLERANVSGLSEISALLKAKANEIEQLGSKLIDAVFEEEVNEEEIKKLLEAGADINYADPRKEGKTALTLVSDYGDEKTVRLLLQQDNIDVNKASDGGETALMWASHRGHKEIVKLLLAAKADVNKANSKGMTALIVGIKNAEISDILIKAGADVTKVEQDGHTALMVAILNREDEYVKSVKLLLESFVDREAKVQYITKANRYGNKAIDFLELKDTELKELLQLHSK